MFLGGKGIILCCQSYRYVLVILHEMVEAGKVYATRGYNFVGASDLLISKYDQLRFVSVNSHLVAVSGIRTIILIAQ